MFRSGDEHCTVVSPGWTSVSIALLSSSIMNTDTQLNHSWNTGGDLAIRWTEILDYFQVPAVTKQEHPLLPLLIQ